MSTGKIRVLFDAIVLENSLGDKVLRTGVYFTAYNIIRRMLRRGDMEISFFTHNKRLLRRYLGQYLPEFGNIAVIDDPARINGDIDAYFAAWYPRCRWVREYFPAVSCYSVIYDIIGLVHPEFLLGMKLPAMWDVLNDFAVNDHCFAISEHTKKDVIRMGRNIDPDDITVVPLAAGEHFHRNTDAAALKAAKKKYHIPENRRYILSLCSLEPRKNLVRAVNAFIEFIEKNAVDDIVYVLAGNPWRNFREEMGRYVAGLGRHADRVIATGYVADEDIAVLYSNALWFVYTSQYEGFGLPPLEAMQCGCPVVTSNNTSLPEVVGDAGIMVDSLDIGQHVAAYEAYWRRPELREENTRKGLERAELFSWDRCTDIICSKMLADAEKKRSRPKVSVVVPANYSAPSGDVGKMQRSLDSVRAQDYPEKAVMIVDCGADAGVSGRIAALAAAAGAAVEAAAGSDPYQACNAVLPGLDGGYATFLEPGASYPSDRHIAICMAKSVEHGADLSYADSRDAAGHPGEVRAADIGNIGLGEHFRRSAAFVKVSTLRRTGGFAAGYGSAAFDELIMRLVRDGRKTWHVQHTPVTVEDGDNAKAPTAEYARAFFDVFGSGVALTRDEFAILYSGAYATDCPDLRVLELAAKLPFELGGWAVCKRMMEERHTEEFVDRKMREAMTGTRHILLGCIPLSCSWIGDSLRSVAVYRWRGMQVIKVLRRGVQAFYSLFGIVPLFTRKSK